MLWSSEQPPPSPLVRPRGLYMPPYPYLYQLEIFKRGIMQRAVKFVLEIFYQKYFCKKIQQPYFTYTGFEHLFLIKSRNI